MRQGAYISAQRLDSIIRKVVRGQRLTSPGGKLWKASNTPTSLFATLACPPMISDRGLGRGRGTGTKLILEGAESGDADIDEGR